MKTCNKCQIEKNDSEFFKKKERWLEGSCKECKKKKILDRQKIDPEKHREKVRLRSEQRRKTEKWKQWRKDHQFRKRKEISEKAQIYYSNNEFIRNKAKEWRKKNRKRLNGCIENHNQKNPLKVACRRFLRTAIDKGIIVRYNACSCCLKKCKPEAHHKDYTKPLEVIWLCRSCHGKEHRKHK